MGVQLDVVIPPIIVGMLIIIIFRVNAFMMDSSIDNRVYNDMQGFAETSAVVMDDLLRRAKSVVNTDDFEDDDICSNFQKQDGSADTNCSDELVFIMTNNFKITFRRDTADNNILISRIKLDSDGNEISGSNTRVYPLNVSKLEFQYKPTEPNFLRYKVETESDPAYHAQNASSAENQKTVKGFAERKIFLRNTAI
jgi:hypothetical protein